MTPTRTQRAVTLVRTIAYEVRSENVTFMAASVAYHAFISLLPLLLLMLAAVSTVGNLPTKHTFLGTVHTILTPGASKLLVGELRRTSASPGTSLVSVGVILWGTLHLFRGLDTAFSDIYASQPRNTIVDQFVDGLVVLGTVTAIVVVTIVLEWKASTLPTGGFGRTLRWLVLSGGLALVFIPMYYVFPDVDDLSLPEILPGVLVATVGMTTLQFLVRAYLDFSQGMPEQSIVTAFLVLLTWLYFSGFVVLLGAVVNAVTANRSRNVNVRPLTDGMPFTERTEFDLEELVATLDKFDDGSLRADGVVLAVDGEDVEFPSPDVVSVDTREDVVLSGSGPVGVELYWSPQRRDDETTERA